MKQQKTLQKNIKYFREKLGLSQEELSARCDYSSTYVGKIERGDRSPSLDTLVRIADALNVALIRLFDPLEAKHTAPGSIGHPGSSSAYDLMIRRFNYLIGEVNREGILQYLRHLPWNSADQSSLPAGNQRPWETDQLNLTDRLAEALKEAVHRTFQGEPTHLNLTIDGKEPTAGVADGLVYPIDRDDQDRTAGFEFFWPRLLEDGQLRPLSETVFDCEPCETSSS